MWIITDQGFYSIVHKPYNPPDILTVRCRCRSDLQRFCDQVPSSSPIQEDVTADYRFRVTAERSEISAWLSKHITDLHYDNFKNHIGLKQGAKRERIYARVWHTLLDLTQLQE